MISLDLTPNSEKKFDFYGGLSVDSDIDSLEVYDGFTVTARLKCEGFTGYNCRFAEPKGDKFQQNPITGVISCKDEKKCYKERKCNDDDDGSFCNKHGQCYKNYTGAKFCICNAGYGGPQCDKKHNGSEEELLFVDDANNLEKATVDCSQCNGRKKYLFIQPVENTSHMNFV
ncbi:hypothetical protein RF11_08268 [Thelohanellus kitauei]|uniref:EGF-like domain-containing protein n=1 Tax=Thelohanellus kitauei TaxID=669202 RepID=A0A0C2MXD9_THEKT|nr:hypothetical protein RF11_08268 [Thelohanellus kitauei]